MDNPYQSPEAVETELPLAIRDQIDKQSSVISSLVGVVVLQWVCHFLTARALFAYINAARIGPTAKTLDLFFYGILSIGFTAILSVFSVIIGIGALRSARGKRKLVGLVEGETSGRSDTPPAGDELIGARRVYRTLAGLLCFLGAWAGIGVSIAVVEERPSGWALLFFVAAFAAVVVMAFASGFVAVKGRGPRWLLKWTKKNVL